MELFEEMIVCSIGKIRVPKDTAMAIAELKSYRALKEIQEVLEKKDAPAAQIKKITHILREVAKI